MKDFIYEYELWDLLTQGTQANKDFFILIHLIRVGGKCEIMNRAVIIERLLSHIKNPSLRLRISSLINPCDSENRETYDYLDY